MLLIYGDEIQVVSERIRTQRHSFLSSLEEIESRAVTCPCRVEVVWESARGEPWVVSVLSL